jgi:hypothetical protein
MLHASLTGQPPFTSGSFVELIQAKEVGTFPPARGVNPDVPESVDRIVARMTAKSADDRYRTCNEVIDALKTFGLGGTGLRLERPAALTAPAAPPSTQQSSMESQPTVTTPSVPPARSPAAKPPAAARTVDDTDPETPAARQMQEALLERSGTAKPPSTRRKPLATKTDSNIQTQRGAAPDPRSGVLERPEPARSRSSVSALPSTARVFWTRLAWWIVAACVVLPGLCYLLYLLFLRG